MQTDMTHVIYIDGVRHRCQEPKGRFFVDSEELPWRYCAQHHLSNAAYAFLQSGGAVRTSGHVYSLHPPVFVPPEVPAPVVRKKAKVLPQHLRRHGHIYAAVFMWVVAVTTSFFLTK